MPHEEDAPPVHAFAWETTNGSTRRRDERNGATEGGRTTDGQGYTQIQSVFIRLYLWFPIPSRLARTIMAVRAVLTYSGESMPELPEDLKRTLETLKNHVEALNIEAAVAAFREEDREQMRREFSEGMKKIQAGGGSWMLEFDDIEVEGDTARGKMISTIAMQEFSEPIEQEIRLVKQAGRWRLAR